MKGRAPFIHIAIFIAFLVNTIGPLAQAEDFRLPAPGTMVSLSPKFNPPILKGIKVHPDNPFRFEFILDQGSSQTGGGLKEESTKLIKYFLASLTIPEKDLWVNLSPYEKNRIIPQSFGLTEMGRDLLAEDYMLKQITASLIYPEGKTGRKFWKKVYAKAQKEYGTTNVAVNTFNKVWIVPEKAVVYENAKIGVAYVVDAKLNVMLEEDYLSLTKHNVLNVIASLKGAKQSSLGSQIIREIVIPELTKEVNQGQNFAQLRQVYNSLILAAWYKKKIKDSILTQIYEDKNKVTGILSSPNASVGDPERIYQQYLKAFKKGAYNYIKEETDPLTQQTLPRKYFSGGATFDPAALAQALSFTSDAASLAQMSADHAMVVEAGILSAVGKAVGIHKDQALTMRDAAQRTLSDRAQISLVRALIKQNEVPYLKAYLNLVLIFAGKGNLPAARKILNDLIKRYTSRTPLSLDEYRKLNRVIKKVEGQLDALPKGMRPSEEQYIGIRNSLNQLRDTIKYPQYLMMVDSQFNAQPVAAFTIGVKNVFQHIDKIIDLIKGKKFDEGKSKLEELQRVYFSFSKKQVIKPGIKRAAGSISNALMFINSPDQTVVDRLQDIKEDILYRNYYRIEVLSYGSEHRSIFVKPGTNLINFLYGIGRNPDNTSISVDSETVYGKERAKIQLADGDKVRIEDRAMKVEGGAEDFANRSGYLSSKISQWLGEWAVEPDPLEILDAVKSGLTEEMVRTVGRNLDELKPYANVDTTKTEQRVLKALPYFYKIYELMMKEYPKGKILFAGRDARILYFFFKVLTRLRHEDSSRFIQIPGSQAFYEEFGRGRISFETVSKYLNSIGIYKEDIEAGERLVVIDSGFQGTVGLKFRKMIQQVWRIQKDLSEQIPIRLVCQNNIKKGSFSGIRPIEFRLDQLNLAAFKRDLMKQRPIDNLILKELGVGVDQLAAASGQDLVDALNRILNLKNAFSLEDAGAVSDTSDLLLYIKFSRRFFSAHLLREYVEGKRKVDPEFNRLMLEVNYFSGIKGVSRPLRDEAGLIKLLKKNGYISIDGYLTARFRDLKDYSDLGLDDHWQPYARDIFKYLSFYIRFTNISQLRKFSGEITDTFPSGENSNSINYFLTFTMQTNPQYHGVYAQIIEHKGSLIAASKGRGKLTDMIEPRLVNPETVNPVAALIIDQMMIKTMLGLSVAQSEALVDRASVAKLANGRLSDLGGIDFTANRTPLEIQNGGKGIKFYIDPAMLQQLKDAPGFVPVVISIRPLKSLQEFLGIV